VDEETKAKIMAKDDVAPLALPEAVDEHGVANPDAKKGKRRARISSFYYKDNVPLPSEEELAEAQHHIQHELHEAVEAGSQAAAEIEQHQPH
jgi:ubiquinol-cytochrome c reductase cytochrome b subunit